jgi:hypothetical protein
LVLEVYAVQLGQEDITNATQGVPFTIIGGDQGRARTPTTVTRLVVAPAQRFDIIINFAPHVNQRLIVKNIGGDEPFGGDIPGPQLYEHTDKIMAFDVVNELDESVQEDKFVIQEGKGYILVLSLLGWMAFLFLV